MEWWEISFPVPSEASEAAAALIQDWPEVQGVSMEGRVASGPSHPEYGEWFDPSLFAADDILVSFYVPADIQEPELRRRLDAVFGRIHDAGLDIGEGMQGVSLGKVDESSWEAAWKTEYRPIEVGRQLVIVPKWRLDEMDDQSGRIPILLEPGMAFGTGTHQTTQLCLQSLEQLDLVGKRVLDIGCGTAVIAIAAAKLGAAEVTAIDIDPVAVRIARENIIENAVQDVVQARQGDLLTGVDTALFDVAVANILRDVVIALAPQAADRLKPGGLLIASGFVTSQVAKVVDGFGQAGFDVRSQTVLDDWVMLVGVKRA